MMEKAFVIIRQKLNLFKRKTIYLSLACCVSLPLLILGIYAESRGAKGFILFAFFLSVLNLVCGWWLLRTWEKKMQKSVAQLVQAKIGKIQNRPEEVHAQEIQHVAEEFEKAKLNYEQQMDKKLEEMRLAYLEFEDLRKEFNRLEEESARHQEEAQKNLKQKDALLSEYQKTIAEQRAILEKKQRYIAKLEDKVRDLMYEIRSLLQLETPTSEGLDVSQQAIIDSFLPSASAPHTPYDFSVQLHKCIEKVEGLTGVNHLGYVGGKSPRFLDLSLEAYAVDRRRLMDTFKDEGSGITFIYSPKERKFLFVNPVVKSVMGWSPEKFMKDFPHLVVQGYLAWEEALSKIKTLREFTSKLAILNKAGQTLPFECYMGKITKGPFTHHVLGIFALS